MPSLDEKRRTPCAPAPGVSTASATENLPQAHLPPTLNLATEEGADPGSPKNEFDPCQNAKPCSPFFNHDTPRCSVDNFRSKTSLHVSVRDLEAQNGLTPCDTPEARPSPGEKGTLKPWATSTNIFGREKSRCLTKPKQRGCDCMSNLPKRQRLLIKILIALVIVGAMVGIGVGISLKVGGTVYKDQNSTAKIGSV